MFKLGLIGDNIAASKAPLLHETAGRLSGVSVTYERLVPKDMLRDFDGVFDFARDTGFRGVNVTYPYKERAAQKAYVADPLVRAIGAVNTVVFSAQDAPAAQGFNTDYTGFIWAYRSARQMAPAGIVCVIGAGGVGKAVAFGLVKLGAKVIRLVDKHSDKAMAVAQSLKALNSGVVIEIASDAEQAAKGADGLINCTPLGMVGVGGSPLPQGAMTGASWAFDAVYTPIETAFLTDAKAAGLDVISGYELFFGQGIDAWAIFTGAAIDHARLRQEITP